MLGKTQTSLRQSLEFQTRITGGWLGCCGRWCQKRQTDQGGKDMTTSVIRWHWWDDHGYTAELFQWIIIVEGSSKTGSVSFTLVFLSVWTGGWRKSKIDFVNLLNAFIGDFNVRAVLRRLVLYGVKCKSSEECVLLPVFKISSFGPKR